MRRILSVVLGLALAGNLLYMVYAQAFFQTNQPTLILHSGPYRIDAGKTYSLQVNPQLVTTEGDTWGDISEELELQIVVEPAEFALRLGFSLAESDNGRWFPSDYHRGNSMLEMTVYPDGDGIPGSVPYDGTVKVTAYNGSKPAGTSQFHLEILQEEKLVESLSFTSGRDEVEMELEAAGIAYIPLDSDWLASSKGISRITEEMILENHIAPSVINNSSEVSFSASIVLYNGEPVIRLALEGTPADHTLYNPVVQLTAANGPLAGQSKEISIKLWHTSLEITGPATNGTAPVEAEAIPASVTVGTTLNLIAPDNNFQWLTGRDRETTLAYLNRNKDWIVLSAELAKLVEKEFYIANWQNGIFGIRLTTVATGTIPAGSTVSVNGQEAYVFSQAVQLEPEKKTGTTAGNRITGIAADTWLGNQVLLNGKEFPSNHLQALEVSPGDELRLLMDSDFFTWENGAPSPVAAVTKSDLTAGKISVKASSGQSSKAVDKVELVNYQGEAAIRVWFVDHFVSTKERDFSLTVTLLENNRKHTESQVVLEGTIDNDEIELDSTDDYVDLSDGRVAYAAENIRSIDVYLGEDVTLRTRMQSGKRYYGYATQRLDSGDEEILNAFPQIDTIYHLYTINLNNSSSKVSIDTYGDRYYVYNAYGEYLGTTRDSLPYSTRYYLASAQIELANYLSDTQIDGGYEVINDDEVPLANGATQLSTQETTASISGNVTANPSNGRAALPWTTIALAIGFILTAVPIRRKRKN